MKPQKTEGFLLLNFLQAALILRVPIFAHGMIRGTETLPDGQLLTV